MNCYCQETLGYHEKVLVCSNTNCRAAVHSKCYKNVHLDRPFYCEACLLMMRDPLVGYEKELAEEYLTYSQARNGIFSTKIEIEPKHIKRLAENDLFLNVFIVAVGDLEPEKVEIDMFTGGISHRITVGRYNLLSWKTIKPNFKFKYLPKENILITCSFATTRFEGQRRLFITLARKINKQNIYDNVFSKTVSSLGNQVCSQSLEKIRLATIGKNVPEVMSMLCPLTLTPMKWPGKGRSCKHPRFFCLKNYLDMNLETSSEDSNWTCPVCKEKLYYCELFLDELMKDYIERHIEEENSSFNQTDQSENQTEQPRGTQGDQKENENMFKLYVYDFQVYSYSEIQHKFPKIIGKGKTPGHNTVNRAKVEHGEAVMNGSGTKKAGNPNTLTMQYLPQQYIEVTQTSIPAIPSRASMASPLISNRTIGYDGTKMATEKSTPGVSLSQSPKIDSNKDLQTDPAKDGKSQEEAARHKEDSVRSMLQKHSSQSSKEKIVPEDMEEIQGRIWVTEDLVCQNSGIGVVNLRPVPDVDSWRAEMFKRNPNRQKLLASILEYRSSLRFITDQIYLVVSKMDINEPPEMKMLMEYVWLAALDIDSLRPAKKVGEILGWFSNLYSEGEQMAATIIAYTKKEHIFGPNSVQDLLNGEDKLENIAERQSQFIFGLALGLSLPNNDQTTSTRVPTSFGTLLANCVWLLDTTYDCSLEKPTEQETDGDIFLEAYAHYILAVVRLMSVYLAAFIGQPKKSMTIFIEIVARLDRPDIRELAYYKDKCNLAV